MTTTFLTKEPVRHYSTRLSYIADFFPGSVDRTRVYLHLTFKNPVGRAVDKCRPSYDCYLGKHRVFVTDDACEAQLAAELS